MLLLRPFHLLFVKLFVIVIENFFMLWSVVFFLVDLLAEKTQEVEEYGITYDGSYVSQSVGGMNILTFQIWIHSRPKQMM